MVPHNMPTLISASVSPNGPFPSPEQLLCAVQGHLDNQTAISGWARTLGDLYREWIADSATSQRIHAEIGEVIGAIDAWISGQLPRPIPGSPRGMDSVGGAIARVAEAWACACWALHDNDDPVQRHRAWDHLAEMREGYADLVQQIQDRRIILPKSWPGLRWPAIITADRHLSDAEGDR